jgi:two-component sensor histidine kinase
LPPEAARHLLLIVHELATNAVKYGALSRPEGRVVIDWTRKGSELAIGWTEQGGPPAAPPARRGFGSVLIAQSTSALAGRIEPRFTPDGFSCSLLLPLPR